MNYKAKAVELILEERARQIEKEGYTHEMDDICEGHQLMIAGACYEREPDRREEDFLTHCWPFEKEAWKPVTDQGTAGRIRELVKAGALYTAELDRLNRASRQLCKFKAAAKTRIIRVSDKIAVLLEQEDRKEAVNE